MLSAICLTALSGQAFELADTTVSLSAEIIAGGSTGDFAPYMIGSWNHGKTPSKSTALFEASAIKPLRLDRRFSWGFGADFLTGYSSKQDYARYEHASSSWTSTAQGPAAAWLQQLYGEVKYRGVFLTVGLKEHESAILNSRLSSGDFIESGNSRPIPEVRAGFVDFQNIPFTNGWVQIQGEISYGVMPDDKYMTNHYNYYSYHLNTDAFYSYKRCYFRTKPSQPLSVTVGMQVGGFFGGKTSFYNKGVLTHQEQFSKSVKTFFKMLLPTEGNGNDYYEGSSLGCWDFKARYRLKSGAEVSAYFQWPFEDGSGIGKMNGFDGIWGIELRLPQSKWLKAVVAEYVDFRNQSGPIHWAPSDRPGTTITSNATGFDNYYNNASYNSYANYGMAIGTPFLLSPVYNLDGYPAFACTRTSGFHIGGEGSLSSKLDWRLLLSYRHGLGGYDVPYTEARNCTSAMVNMVWRADVLLPGLVIDGKVAFDAGKLQGNNFGVMAGIGYNF